MSANAATIVDTGPGPSSNGISLSLFGPIGPSPGQSLAAEFDIGSSTTVTDIEGWMSGTVFEADGTIAIYSDGGDVPDTELYAATFLGTGSTAWSWEGTSGLSWDLAPGSYWVSFEVRSGQTLSTGMVTPSTNPLLNEAINNTGEWIGSDSLELGIRIEGSVVPIPAAVWLFGSGLLGLIGVARRKKTV